MPECDAIHPPHWYRWAIRLRAIAQSGRALPGSAFDEEQYRTLTRIAAEMMAEQCGTALPRTLQLHEQETGYATPKVDVRGAIFRDDAVLLVRGRSDRRWSLPGGWADVGVTPSETLARRIREQVGFDVQPVKLLALLDGRLHGPPFYPYPFYRLFIKCGIVSAVARSSEEIPQVDFFRDADLSGLSIDRVTEMQARRMLLHQLNPEWPTDFD